MRKQVLEIVWLGLFVIVMSTKPWDTALIWPHFQTIDKFSVSYFRSSGPCFCSVRFAAFTLAFRTIPGPCENPRPLYRCSGPFPDHEQYRFYVFMYDAFQIPDQIRTNPGPFLLTENFFPDQSRTIICMCSSIWRPACPRVMRSRQYYGWQYGFEHHLVLILAPIALSVRISCLQEAAPTSPR